MKPTLVEIKNEIENGVLSEECLQHWSKVFNDQEPLKTKLLQRQGILIPDAAYEIYKILSDPSKFNKQVTKVSRGSFIAGITPLAISIAQLPEVKKNYWTLLMTLLTGGDDEVEINRPQITAILNAAISDGLLTEGQKLAIQSMGGTTTQSRLQELGWDISLEDIQKAKLI